MGGYQFFFCTLRVIFRLNEGAQAYSLVFPGLAKTSLEQSFHLEITIMTRKTRNMELSDLFMKSNSKILIADRCQTCSAPDSGTS